MKKLLIADTTEEFRHALAEVLRSAYIVKTCHDGKEALHLLQTFRPDVLVIDLLLPEVDGVTVLQRAVKLGLKPEVLAVTRYASDYILEAVTRLGVGYVMRKPCDIHAVASRLADLTDRTEYPAVTRIDDRTAVTNLLLSLSFSTKLRGYPCLREALLIAMENPGQSVTKVLYPAVAEICGGNGRQVEHVIRSAIAAAWQRRDDRVWRQYFQPGPDGTVPRPTNAVFISRMADRMVLSQMDVG